MEGEGLCVEAIDQAGQHRYDTHEHLFPGANTIAGNQSFGDRRIKASGALECRAAGVIEKLGALATLPFTVPFGRIPTPQIVLVVVVVLRSRL